MKFLSAVVVGFAITFAFLYVNNHLYVVRVWHPAHTYTAPDMMRPVVIDNMITYPYFVEQYEPEGYHKEWRLK